MHVTAKCFPCGSVSYSKHFPRGTSYKPFFPSHGYLWEQAQPHSFKESRELLLCFVPLSFQFFPKKPKPQISSELPQVANNAHRAQQHLKLGWSPSPPEPLTAAFRLRAISCLLSSPQGSPQAEALCAYAKSPAMAQLAFWYETLRALNTLRRWPEGCRSPDICLLQLEGDKAGWQKQSTPVTTFE